MSNFLTQFCLYLPQQLPTIWYPTMRGNATVFFIMLALLAGCADRPKSQDRPISSMFQHDGTLTFERRDSTILATINIEIAETPQRRETGLMGRPTLGENNGMLFIFQEEQPLSFWMMNTLISLDMIFVDAQKEIVTIHSKTTPFSSESYPSAKAGMYVVEVNAGFCEQHGIREGDKIVFQRSSK